MARLRPIWPALPRGSPAHGFTVEPLPAGRRLVLFSGTAQQVADAFHTEMHRYEVSGQEHIANSQDPQIPSALAPVVAGVLSMHDFRRTSASRPARQIAKPENTQGSTHYLFPADYATIYDLNPQYAAGKNGSGASIAIVGRSNINLSDVSSFRSTSGLTANQPAVVLDGVNPGRVSGDQDESTLDVEWSGAVAPGAAVKFVVAASTSTTDGVDLSAQYIVNNKTATVMSTSYGSCEANMGSGEVAFYNSLWQQAASEGISAFVSSGDSGAAGCNSGGSSSGSMTGVNGLCSSPYSTCVGGTEFNEGSNSSSYWSSSNGTGGESALSYIPEKVWNESANDGGSGLWASGGGVSEYLHAACLAKRRLRSQQQRHARCAGRGHDSGQPRRLPDLRRRQLVRNCRNLGSFAFVRRNHVDCSAETGRRGTGQCQSHALRHAFRQLQSFSCHAERQQFSSRRERIYSQRRVLQPGDGPRLGGREPAGERLACFRHGSTYAKLQPQDFGGNRVAAARQLRNLYCDRDRDGSIQQRGGSDGQDSCGRHAQLQSGQRQGWGQRNGDADGCR